MIYKEDIQLFELILCHWYRSIPPEKIQKIRLFLKFSGGMEKGVIRILVQDKAILLHKINMETLQHPFTGISFVYFFLTSLSSVYVKLMDIIWWLYIIDLIFHDL